jgi:asparagine synthetase B (glutamine-hydrolysing)
MCKPVLPLLRDELAHIFWKAKHLATVHHHHGVHHAEEEVADVVAETLYAISQPTIHKQTFAVNSCSISTFSLDKYYPPPKWC